MEFSLKKKAVSLREINDDNSPYMQELTQKFINMYGTELTEITGLDFEELKTKNGK